MVWPGNESCLYGAGEHKERLSGSGRWPRLGQLSSLSAKHNLSCGRVSTLAHPATSVSHLQERGGGEGWVGKGTMNAHMNDKMEYYAAKNTLMESMVHCKPTVLSVKYNSMS